jgi:hypothetical protein
MGTRYMIGRRVFSTSRRIGHDTLRRERRSMAIVTGVSWLRAGYDLIGDMLGADSRERRLLLEKRLRSLWGLSHAGVGLTLRMAAWRRARCSSAAEDVSGAVGRRATTCATAEMREVRECSMAAGADEGWKVERSVCEVQLGR